MNQEKFNKTAQYIVENQEKFYRLAFSYVKNREDALDVVQNAACKALHSCGSLRNDNALNTWFYRIVVNESLTFLQKRKEEHLSYEEETEIPYYEKGYEIQDDLYEQIGQLESDVQSVIKLRYFEELSLKEIAEVMNMNLNTVKAKLYRGLKQLNQRMEGKSI